MKHKPGLVLLVTILLLGLPPAPTTARKWSETDSTRLIRVQRACRDGIQFDLALEALEAVSYPRPELTLSAARVSNSKIVLAERTYQLPAQRTILSSSRGGEITVAYFRSLRLRWDANQTLQPGTRVYFYNQDGFAVRDLAVNGDGWGVIAEVQDCQLNAPATEGFGSTTQELANWPIPLTRTVYIYQSDFSTRNDFHNLLRSHGFPAGSLTVKQAETFDFGPYDLIIIGSDTGKDANWGNAAALAHISDAGLPTIGIGEGGYAFYRALGLALAPETIQRTSRSAYATSNSFEDYYFRPYTVAVNRDPTPDQGLDIATLYQAKVATIEPYGLPDDPNIRVLGTAPTTQQVPSYPLLAYAGSVCSTFWGFTGPPAQMTASGQDLLLNLVYMGGCYATAPHRRSMSQSVITIPDQRIVADLDVYLHLRHPNPEQLTISLTAPSGKTITLLGGLPTEQKLLGGTISSTKGSIKAMVRLDDQSAYNLEAASTTDTRLAGVAIRPNRGKLAGFSGEQAAGTWMLVVEDNTPNTNAEEDGALLRWGLEFTSHSIYLPVVRRSK